MRCSSIAAGLLLSSLASALQAAPIYRWVDAQGQTHFGSQPPVSDARQLPNAHQPPAPQPAAAPASVPAAAGGKPDALEKRVSEEVAKTEKEREDYCVRVRTNLTQMRNNPRLQVEENGARRRLTEQERQSRMQEAEKAIGETCKD